MTRITIITIIFSVLYIVQVNSYTKPLVKLEAKYLKGLRVSVPEIVDEEGKAARSRRHRRQTCEKSQTVMLGLRDICKGELIFSEDFDKPNFKDLTNWESENIFPQEPDYPFNVYLADEAVKIDNGVLKIIPTLTDSRFGKGFINDATWHLIDKCTGRLETTECTQTSVGPQILPPIISGKITTRNHFNFKFGRIEVRAKLPAGSWLLPDINLEALENVNENQRYASGLIRVAYLKGNPEFSKTLYAGPVFNDVEPSKGNILKEKIGIDNWNKDYHNYTLIWKPDSIQTYVDGEQYGDMSTEQTVAVRTWLTRFKDQFFHISLGVRAGGILAFADSNSKPWKNRSIKGIFRFWQHKDSWYPTWTSPDLAVDSVKVYAV